MRRATPVEALEACLLFHGIWWGDTERRRWAELTGESEATTKVLCDLIRLVLLDPAAPFRFCDPPVGELP